jgi:hypothetical protein
LRIRYAVSDRVAGVEEPSSHRVAGLIIPIGLYLAGALVFFRSQFLTGFDLLFGDRGDTRLVVFLHEHVYRALLDFEGLRSPPFFYNESLTLGYGDAFLLNEVVYAPLRLLRVEPFLAVSMVTVVLSALAYGFGYLLLRRLEVSPIVAALCATVMTFPNNLYLKSGHLQHFAVYFLPIVIYCTLAAAMDVHKEPRRSYLLGALAAGLLGMVFSTGFYMAWFFGLALIVLLVSAVLWARPAAREWWRRGPTHVIWLSVISGLSLLAALAVFAFIYAPVVITGVGRTVEEYLVNAPEPQDLVNVGLTNLVWSDPIRELGLVSEERLGFHEVAIALTPGLQLLLLVSGFLAFRSRLWPQGLRAKAIRGLVLGGLAVFVSLFVLTVKIGDRTLFQLLYSVVPGATAIRAGYRGMIVANLFAVIAIALAFDRRVKLARRDAGGARRLLGIAIPLALLAMLPVEQINLGRPTNLSRTDENAHLSTLVDAPDECLTFYMAAQQGRASYEVQIDGMLIALANGIPTVNGYSGLEPPGWDLDAAAGDYEQRAARWALNRGIAEGLCRADLMTGTWTVIDSTS